MLISYFWRLSQLICFGEFCWSFGWANSQHFQLFVKINLHFLAGSWKFKEFTPLHCFIDRPVVVNVSGWQSMKVFVAAFWNSHFLDGCGCFAVKRVIDIPMLQIF